MSNADEQAKKIFTKAELDYVIDQVTNHGVSLDQAIAQANALQTNYEERQAEEKFENMLIKLLHSSPRVNLAVRCLMENPTD